MLGSNFAFPLIWASPLYVFVCVCVSVCVCVCVATAPRGYYSFSTSLPRLAGNHKRTICMINRHQRHSGKNEPKITPTHNMAARASGAGPFTHTHTDITHTHRHNTHTHLNT